MTTTAHQDIAHRIMQAQDDDDTVVLPNACKGQVIQFSDGARVRCFSVLVREPHTVPHESWSLITAPAMPDIDSMDELVPDRVMVDHVTRGFIGDNAMQFSIDQDGDIVAIRLLPPGTGPAQQQWDAQANKMIGG